MAVIAQFDLGYQSGSSDKVYHAQVVDVGGGLFAVNFQYGRRGSTLQTGTKTPSPVMQNKAIAIFNALREEKLKKGYQDIAPVKAPDAAAPTPRPTQAKPIIALPQLLNPVRDEEHLEQLIQSPLWIMQEKVDGERRMVKVVTSGVVQGINCSGHEVPLPLDVKDALRALNLDSGIILDGELVGDRYYVFDVIGGAGVTLADRIGRLESIPINSAFSTSSKARTLNRVSVATTIGEKRTLLAQVRADGGEGVVFKQLGSLYEPGRPDSGGTQLKYKLYATAVVRVMRINAQRSVLVGVVADDSSLQAVGNVTIPPNAPLPALDSLLQVRYLYAYPGGGSLYQPVYQRPRADVDEAYKLSSLKFKVVTKVTTVEDPAAFLAW